MNDIKILTVSTKQLSELFGVSEGYISDLVNDHGMPKIGFNEFNLFDCVKFRFLHLEKISEDQKDRLRDSTNRGRLDAANAELKELELQVKKGSLVPTIEFEMALMNTIRIFIKGLDTLPTKLSIELIDAKTQSEMMPIIKKETDSIRTQIANFDPRTPAAAVKFE